jgi:hypothetical protein
MTTEEQAALIEAVKSLVTELKDGVTSQISALSQRCDSIDAKLKKADGAGERRRGPDENEAGVRRFDADEIQHPGEHPGDARRVAADRQARSDNFDPAAFAALSSSVAELKKRQSRPMADLNAFADTQAKADSVMRALGSAAEPPMAGEDLVSYKIRMHRKMQPHSPRWKGVELQLIAADQVALDNILGEIRADAMTAATSPVGMPEFQHRKITETAPGGHTITRFVGNGTIFKQLSRPVRHVAYIGTRTGTGQ